MKRFFLFLPVLVTVCITLTGCPYYKGCMCFDEDTHMYIKKHVDHNSYPSNCDELENEMNIKERRFRYECHSASSDLNNF